MTEVIHISHSVDVSFNKERDVIYMDIYTHQINGNSLLQRTVIPYVEGTKDIDLLMSKWAKAINGKRYMEKAIVDGFRKELKELLLNQK